MPDLRYGINPHQSPATYASVHPDRSPITVVNGEPSYINLLDALNAWQLVRAAARSTGRVAAASFKHVSPAGAALDGPLDASIRHTYRVGDVSDVASAYLRARDADPKSSYGDFVAASGPVDADLADLLSRMVSDGIVAPDYEPGTVARLAAKKRGRFLVLRADPAFEAPTVESREVFGLRLTQPRDRIEIPAGLGPDAALGLATIRFTQSNSVAFVKDGVAIGIGAGQQSRIDCTALAGAKAEMWWRRRHPSVFDVDAATTSGRIAAQLARAQALPAGLPLAGVTFVSDGALPFADNIDEAARHGVQTIVEPGGSARSAAIARHAAALGIRLIATGVRQFHH